jgi:crotonobetainyl-CoA:carnitine CoA-transferase CaiB-like acyl-CoA transferase
MTGTFESITVLDLTHVLPGPFCTYQFALLGADVIKIEPPDCGWGRSPDPAANAQGLVLNYQVQVPNKHPLALDLSQPEGRDIFLKLAAAQRSEGARPKASEAGICPYQTRDGILRPGAFTQAQYRKLAVCLEDLGIDLPGAQSIGDWPDVWANADSLKSHLASIFATRTADKWVRILHAADIPVERIATLAEAVINRQLDARTYFSPHPTDAEATLPLGPSRFSTGGPSIVLPPPRHGEHCDEILSELDMTPAEVEVMRAKGIVR